MRVEPVDAERPIRGGHSRFLSVQWVASVEPMQACVSIAHLHHITYESSYPFQLGLVLEAGVGSADAALTVHAPTADLADAAALTVHRGASGTVPWIGLGEPEATWSRTKLESAAAAWRFDPGGNPFPARTTAAPFVATATELDGRFQLVITTGSRDELSGPNSWGKYRCGIALFGDRPATPEADLLATLVADDVGGAPGVHPVRAVGDELGILDRARRNAAVRTNLVLTTGSIGRLLAMPQRCVGSWPLIQTCDRCINR